MMMLGVFKMKETCFFECLGPMLEIVLEDNGQRCEYIWRKEEGKEENATLYI